MLYTVAGCQHTSSQCMCTLLKSCYQSQEVLRLVAPLHLCHRHLRQHADAAFHMHTETLHDLKSDMTDASGV